MRFSTKEVEALPVCTPENSWSRWARAFWKFSLAWERIWCMVEMNYLKEGSVVCFWFDEAISAFMPFVNHAPSVGGNVSEEEEVVAGKFHELDGFFFMHGGVI